MRHQDPTEPDPVVEPEPDPVVEPEPDPVVEPEPDPVVGETAVFDLGDTVPLSGLSGLMRLPDGTVVTCRSTYLAQHVGQHAFIVTKDGETAEVEFVVVEPTEDDEA